MHAFYRDQDTSALQRRQFRPEHFPTLAMRPQEAVRRLVKNDVDYLPIDELYGRIATTLWVVYPPGIATIVPGERLDERAQPMIDYLKVFERGIEPVSRFRERNPGRISRKTAGRIDPDLYLCDPVSQTEWDCAISSHGSVKQPKPLALRSQPASISPNRQGSSLPG